MRPSMRRTVEFQRGKSSALVSSAQIRSAGASMSIATAYSRRNVVRVRRARPSAVKDVAVIESDDDRGAKKDALPGVLDRAPVGRCFRGGDRLAAAQLVEGR